MEASAMRLATVETTAMGLTASESTTAVRIAVEAAIAPTVKTFPATEAAVMRSLAATKATFTVPAAVAAKTLASETVAPVKVTVSPATLVSTATVVAGSNVESAFAVEAMKPGSRADEHTIVKIVRAVIPVGSAVVRSVIVISVRANRRRPHIDRADADRHAHLRVGRSCSHYQDSKQNRVL